MSQEPQYRQCRFETETSAGRKVDVAWIPEESARVGQRIYIDEPWADPGEVWVITAVYARRPKDWVVQHRQDYRHQRKASDV
jgi:hypothetical protein